MAFRAEFQREGLAIIGLDLALREVKTRERLLGDVFADGGREWRIAFNEKEDPFYFGTSPSTTTFQARSCCRSINGNGFV